MYALLETLEPVSHAQFLEMHPNVGFPLDIPDYMLIEYGVARIEEDPLPSYPFKPGDLRREGDRIIRSWIDISNDPEVVETSFKTRLANLNQDYEGAMAALRASYPESETKTWTIQREEAYAYSRWKQQVEANGAEAAGPAPETPFITALSAGRDAAGTGAGFDDLVSRIIANDKLYTPAVAKVTSIRHGAEARLLAAFAEKSLASLEAVTWTFSAE